MGTSAPLANDAQGGIMSSSSNTLLAAILLTGTVVISKLSAADFTQQENIVYGHKHGLGLLMDVFTPEKQNGGGVIWIVSGGMNSSRRSIPQLSNNPNFTALIDHGYTIFAVMHGSQPKFALQEIVKDLPRAVRYIRYHAKRFGIDENKLGVTGRSSGGQLALFLAMAAKGSDPEANDPIDRISSRIQAAAVYFPGTDMVNFGKKNRTILEHFHTRGFKADATFDFHEWSNKTKRFERITNKKDRIRYYKQLSPIMHVTPDDPPVLLIHGDKDKLVPFQQSLIFDTRLKEVGVTSKLFVAGGKDHGWRQPVEGELKVFLDWFDDNLLNK